MKKIPNILTTVYLILVVLGAIPIFTGGDALSGIFAVALTAPWNSLLSSLFSAPGNMIMGLLFVAIGAAINAAIIYYLSRWIVNRLAK